MARLPMASPWPSFHWNHLSPAPRPPRAPLRTPQPVSHLSTPNPPHASPTAPRAPVASVPGPSAPFPACSRPLLSPPQVSNHFPPWYRPRARYHRRPDSPSCSIQTPTHFSPTCAWLLSYPILGNEFGSRSAPTQRR